MTIDRTELRGIAAEVHKRNLSVKFGDPRYSCVVGSDELLALVSGVPKLMAELDAKDRRIAELETSNAERGQAIVSYQRALEDLQLRLSIATESNVNDRKRIAELEVALAGDRSRLSRAEHLLREYGIDPYAGLP